MGSDTGQTRTPGQELKRELNVGFGRAGLGARGRVMMKRSDYCADGEKQSGTMRVSSIATVVVPLAFTTIRFVMCPT
jgi:hypothetical protein